MKPIFEYTKGMTEMPTHYCPGCTHGIAHRLIMEVLDEMGMLAIPSAWRPSAAPSWPTST